MSVASQGTQPQAKRGRLLFVDDEPRVLNTMTSLFKREYDVLVATSGPQALEMLKKNEIHVLVSDQRMPEMTGTEVLRAAREISPKTMRLLLTGYLDFSAVVDSINEGEVYRFMHKPWSNDALRQTIHEATEIAKNPTSATAALQPSAEIPEAAAEAGVLILDDEEADVASLKHALTGEFTTYHAATIDQCMTILEQHEVGVVIAESHIGGRDITGLIGLLKEHHPHIVTIVLAARGDAETAIDLINQGQIYRFLLKPAREGISLQSVKSAMRHYLSLAQNPELTKRFKVEQGAATRSSAMEDFLQRLQKFRVLSRFKK